MKFVTFLSLLVLLPLARGANNAKCSSQSACSCNVTGLGPMSLEGQTFNHGESFVEVYSVNFGNTYRFYPCGVDQTWGGDCDTQATACQYSGQEDLYYSIGMTTDYTITDVVTDGANPSITFFYQSGSGGRISTVTVTCDTKATDDTLEFLKEDPTLDYNLQLTTAKICPGGAPSGQGGEPVIPALFIIVILVLFLATVTYLVVGVLLMVFWKGARGLEVIPNFAFWKDFPFLFKDGVLFSFSYIPAARSRIGGDKGYSSLK